MIKNYPGIVLGSFGKEHQQSFLAKNPTKSHYHSIAQRCSSCILQTDNKSATVCRHSCTKAWDIEKQSALLLSDYKTRSRLTIHSGKNCLNSRKPILPIQIKTPTAMSGRRFHSFGSRGQTAAIHSTELPIWPLVGKEENMQASSQQHFLNKLAGYTNWFHRQTQVGLCPTFSLNRTIQGNI